MRRAAPILGLALLATCSGGTEEKEQPPVVLIVLDALHGFHVSHLGYPRETTPNLDALAAEGVTFRRAFAPAPFTLASIPSLMTGRIPASHGVYANTRRLADNEETLAEVFARAGYRTRGAVANLNGGPIYGNTQGFDEVVELYRRDAPGTSPSSPTSNGGVHLPGAEEFLPIIKRWCGEEDARPPFFYLHLLEPHEPYVPPDDFRERFQEPDYDGPFRAGLTVELALEHLKLYGEINAPGRDEKDAVVALYDANIAWVDSVLGGVVAELKRAGIYEQAWIVVTSDHGEAFWQHGRRGHGGFLYDEELRVPLVVKPPRGSWDTTGRKVDHLASIVDVFPSLCEWIGIPLRTGGLDGVSLQSLMDDEAHNGSDDRELFIGSYRPKYLAALRTANAKTIVKYDPETRLVERVEHYSIDEDPGEQANVYLDHANDLDATVQRLQAWIRKGHSNSAGEAGELSDIDRAMLEALGYTDD